MSGYLGKVRYPSDISYMAFPAYENWAEQDSTRHRCKTGTVYRNNTLPLPIIHPHFCTSDHFLTKARPTLEVNAEKTEVIGVKRLDKTFFGLAREHKYNFGSSFCGAYELECSSTLQFRGHSTRVLRALAR
jgi:hypothetical protein